MRNHRTRLTVRASSTSEGFAVPLTDWFLTAEERGNPDTSIPVWTAGNTAEALIHGKTYFDRLVTEVESLEEGDLLDAEITAEGILLRPRKVIDASQAWFWNPEWQAGERDAEADLTAGRGEVFTSGEEFLDALRARARPAARRRKR